MSTDWELVIEPENWQMGLKKLEKRIPRIGEQLFSYRYIVGTIEIRRRKMILLQEILLLTALIFMTSEFFIASSNPSNGSSVCCWRLSLPTISTFSYLLQLVEGEMLAGWVPDCDWRDDEAIPPLPIFRWLETWHYQHRFPSQLFIEITTKRKRFSDSLSYQSKHHFALITGSFSRKDIIFQIHSMQFAEVSCFWAFCLITNTLSV